jgi:hypothetical protein
MKALSIRQPWCYLILRPDIVGDEARRQAYADGLIKDIENRSWPTKYRGRVLVHASGGMTRAEYEDVEDWLSSDIGSPLFQIRLPDRKDLERGGIVGAVTITDCVPASRRKSRWHMEGASGFQLADAKPLPFVPCKGALQFFDVPLDVAATLREMHAQTASSQSTS